MTSCNILCSICRCDDSCCTQETCRLLSCRSRKTLAQGMARFCVPNNSSNRLYRITRELSHKHVHALRENVVSTKKLLSLTLSYKRNMIKRCYIDYRSRFSSLLHKRVSVVYESLLFHAGKFHCNCKTHDVTNRNILEDNCALLG
jgi:hypothetical protein